MSLRVWLVLRPRRWRRPPRAGRGGRVALPVLIALACTAAASTAARAQTLTFEQALAHAREQAARVAAAQVPLDAADARVALASRRLTTNPEVEAIVGGASGTPSGTSAEVTVTQRIDAGARRSARIAEAQAGLVSDRARAGDITRAWVREAALLFVRALHAQSRERLMQTAEETAAAFLTTAERRLAAGDVAVLDVNVARAALAKARADRRGVAADQVEAVGQLAARLGLAPPTGTRLTVEGRLETFLEDKVEPAAADVSARFATSAATATDSAAAPKSATAGSGAAEASTAGVKSTDGPATATTPSPPDPLADHPALATFRGELAEAEAAFAAARAATRPEFGAVSKYLKEPGTQTWLGGVTLTLPFANRGRERQAIAATRVTRARLALDLERRALEQEVRTAVDAWRLRVEAARLLEREALPGLDENDTLARRSYEAGELSLTDSLAVRQQALEMRLSYLDSLLDAATSSVQAQTIAGVLR